MMKKVIASALAFAMLLSCSTSSLAAAPLDSYPGIDELPQVDTIPNPFEFFDTKNDPNGDGYVSGVAEWDARRGEIKDLVQHYWLGYRWPTAAKDVQGSYRMEMEPNTVSWGGFFGWGSTKFNLGDEFSKLKDALTNGAVTVNEKVYGPAANTQEAESLAIEAWNAGYSQPYAASPWSPAGDAVFVKNTGVIDKDSIPQKEKPKYIATITIENPDRTDASGQPVSASFEAVVSPPTEKQAEKAWGSSDVKVPFVINIGGSSSAFSAINLNQQGYALVTFTPTDIYPDDSSEGDGISRNGVYTDLYPYDKDEYEYASGAMMAWGWAASQIITALDNPAEGSNQKLGELAGLDPSKTVITGHSRYGKAAMFAAAFDDRISICVPSEPGGSGIQSYRYKVEGKIFNFNAYPKADRVYGKTEIPTVSYGSGNSWFPETAAMFVAKDNQLPFDANEIISLVAPRPFFVVSGIDQHWLGNEGGVASVQAAAEVYEYIGSNETEKNNIAVRCRQSDHVFYPRDFCFALAIMDREFKQEENDPMLHVQDLFPDGGGISGMSYPAADYEQVSSLNSYPFDVNSSYMPWSSENKYMLWTAQENFLTEHDVSITAHSNAPDVDLYLPDGKTRLDATAHEGEVFTFELPAELSVYGRYELRTAGNDKENRSVYFAAVSLADSLRHGTTKGDEGEENRVLGFSSRLANNREDAPLVYVGGSDTPETMCFTPERSVPEATSLLEYGILFHDSLFARIATDGWDASKTFHVKNLKFVTIPDYTFELSFNDIAASAENNGKKDAARFTKPISWSVERYNNGPADLWPQFPDTLEERAQMESGGVIVRPDAPAKTPTGFKAAVTQSSYLRGEASSQIILTFSEPMNTGEFGFGLNIASRWTTQWNEDGTVATLTMANEDITSASPSAGIIIFRLRDTEGNLISGPMELNIMRPELDRQALESLVAEARAVDPDMVTPETYQVLGEALSYAAGWLTDSDVSGGDAISQTDIDAVCFRLLNALNGLEYISAGEELDWRELELEIERAQALDSGRYTQDSYSRVENALEEALALIQYKTGAVLTGEGGVSGGDASESDAPGSPVTEGGLKDTKAADNTNSTADSASAAAVVVTDVSGNHSVEHRQTFASTDKVTQAQIDAAARNLRIAMLQLKEKPADKAALEAYIASARSLDSDRYTADSYRAVLDALKTAEAVLTDENATGEEIANAAALLQKAMDALVEKENPAPDHGSGDSSSASGPLEITADWNAVERGVTARLREAAAPAAAGGSNTVLNFTVGNSAVIPHNILKLIQGSPVTLALHTGNKLAFSITGSEIPEAFTGSLNLSVRQGSSLLPAQLVNQKMQGAIAGRQFELNSKAEFGMVVNAHLDLGKENSGRYANLYRYNPQTQSMEYLNSFQITENGQAMFGLPQGAGYLVTVTADRVADTPAVAGSFYVVRKGDTISAIAARNRLSVSGLMALNPQLDNASRIYPGQKINIR